jgi:ABC-2 type transport system ATP-binding protein
MTTSIPIPGADALPRAAFQPPAPAARSIPAVPLARDRATAPEPAVDRAPVLELRGVTKRYGTVDALRGVDLAVRRGEVVAMLGPNGAGKTTAISILLGLRRPTAGTVAVFGGAPDAPATKARVGAMLQESGVPGTLTVAELIDLFRGYYPAPRPRGDLLAVAGLEEVAGRRVRSLSGGQRQRLYVALALAGDPEIVFLDEPTTGMDVESRRRFWGVIGALAAEGRTVIFATHLLEEADALATRIVVIDRGLVVRDGTPAEIKARAGGATIRLRADVDEAVVAAWPGVLRVGHAGARLEVVAREPQEVLRRLFASGVVVDEISVEEHALETAFLDLTARES